VSVKEVVVHRNFKMKCFCSSFSTRPLGQTIIRRRGGVLFHAYCVKVVSPLSGGIKKKQKVIIH
jgi:hypothetical protein